MPATHRWPYQMRLKLYMVEHDLTSTWLAETVGLSMVVLCGVITGRSRATPRTRALVAQALGVPSTELFTDIEDPTEDEMAAMRVAS